MLINKNDFPQYVKFTTNIADNDINPYIKRAEQFLPRLKNDFYLQVRLLNPITFAMYEPGLTTVAGDYVEYNGELYKALIDTNLAPVNDLTNYALDKYQTVLNLAIKPYLVYKSYDMFLANHGINVTPAGVTQASDSSYEHVSDKRRAEYINNIKSSLVFYEELFYQYLKDYEFMDKPQACGVTHTQDIIGVYVVGKKRKRGCCEDERGYNLN